MKILFAFACAVALFVAANNAPAQQVTATVEWSDTSVRISVPDPYVIAWLQWCYVTPQGVTGTPPVATTPNYTPMAFTEDCTVCDDDPETHVRVVNGAFWQAGTEQSSVEFVWSWSTPGAVSFGGDLRCGEWAGNLPTHVMVYDTTVPVGVKGRKALWYCDNIHDEWNVDHPGAFAWDVVPVSLAVGDTPSDVPIATKPSTWSTVRELYR